MNLVILTPDKELFHGNVTSVNVPAIGGRFEVLNGHAPVVAAIGNGEIRYQLAEGEKRAINVDQGFIEVLQNEVSLLVSGVEEK